MIGRRRTQRYVTAATAGAVALCCSIVSATAQVIEARIGRFYDSAGWTSYRVGFSRPLAGIFGVQMHGDVLRPVTGSSGVFVGLGTDVTAFRTGREGPYIVAGLSGGFGSESGSGLSDPWGSWSAGAGYDLFPISFLSIGAEGRWRELSLGGRDGLEVAVGMSLHLGRRSGAAFQPPLPIPTPLQDADSNTTASAPRSLTDSIIATATEAMGRRYEYGGTGEDGEGFDCSGLIQYAFGKHGITLPRRSGDQAREGKKVDRKLKLLAPADLLTFSNRGSTVTHVGLYIGGGRFIHSATRGVQVSTLSADDPYGRWWYQRWVGVRRIVP